MCQRINWTSGIDQKTGKPVDYDPNRDVQVYSGKQNFTLAEPTKKLCPSLAGGNNYFPPSYSQKTGLIYIPADVDVQRVDAGPGGDQEGHLFQPALEAASSATNPTSSPPIP